MSLLLIVLLLLPTLLLVVSAFWAGPLWLLALIPLFLIPGAIMHALQVRVDDEELTVAFGFGFPRKRMKRSEVQSARAVRNRWWYGFGIRLTPHGWLWNVAGLDAVELDLASGRHFRIGTDDPQGLIRALTNSRQSKS